MTYMTPTPTALSFTNSSKPFNGIGTTPPPTFRHHVLGDLCGMPNNPADGHLWTMRSMIQQLTAGPSGTGVRIAYGYASPKAFNGIFEGDGPIVCVSGEITKSGEIQKGWGGIAAPSGNYNRHELWPVAQPFLGSYMPTLDEKMCVDDSLTFTYLVDDYVLNSDQELIQMAAQVNLLGTPAVYNLAQLSGLSEVTPEDGYVYVPILASANIHTGALRGARHSEFFWGSNTDRLQGNGLARTGDVYSPNVPNHNATGTYSLRGTAPRDNQKQHTTFVPGDVVSHGQSLYVDVKGPIGDKANAFAILLKQPVDAPMPWEWASAFS